jgi:hypothetical protein
VFDLEAAVLDVGEAGLGGDGAGLVAADAELEPESAGPDRDRVPGHLRGVLGAAEHVDQVDRLGHLVEGGQHRHPEQLRLGAHGVDPEQAVALVVEVPGDLVGGALGVGREADHGDHLAVEQQVAKLFVGHGQAPGVGGSPAHPMPAGGGPQPAVGLQAPAIILEEALATPGDWVDPDDQR